MDNMGRKLNWRKACQIMGRSKQRFYRLIQEGILPAFRVQGKKRGFWVWEKDALALFAQIHQVDQEFKGPE